MRSLPLWEGGAARRAERPAARAACGGAASAALLVCAGVSVRARGAKSPARVFGGSGGILRTADVLPDFACYVPMFLITFPGSFAYDVPFQLKQVFTGRVFHASSPWCTRFCWGDAWRWGGPSALSMPGLRSIRLCKWRFWRCVSRLRAPPSPAGAGAEAPSRAALCFALYRCT